MQFDLFIYFLQKKILLPMLQSYLYLGAHFSCFTELNFNDVVYKRILEKYEKTLFFTDSNFYFFNV